MHEMEDSRSNPQHVRHIELADRSALERVLHDCDARGIVHTDIKDLGPKLRLYVLLVWETDGTQVELTAPYTE